ncbi:MAG TPA: DinB family protein [Pyrinomonadaceae bacterium]|nr:DinB family protein [Pyrinomonadaceae bacterium]
MNADEKDRSLREHVLYLLRGGGAHIKFEDAVKDFPAELLNGKVAGVPYTPWQVLEHMRIAQWDILEFSRDPKHVSPDWPEGYWPDKSKEASEDDWRKSVERFREDLNAMQSLVEDLSTDLHAPIPHGTGQSVLREALLVADHNAYHLGVLVTLKRALEDAGSAKNSSG